jgi:hypothetical protein
LKSIICYRFNQCLSVRDDREASERQEERLATSKSFNREESMFPRYHEQSGQLCALNERQSSSRVAAACSPIRCEACTHEDLTKQVIRVYCYFLAEHNVENRVRVRCGISIRALEARFSESRRRPGFAIQIEHLCVGTWIVSALS